MGQSVNVVFRLYNHAGELKFTCRVVHSVPLLTSAAQVYCGDQMAAVAHLIGQDQLPKASQVRPVNSA